MAGYLPHSILWNKMRGKQGADILFRLKNHIETIHHEIARIEKSDLVREYIDINKMRNSLAALHSRNIHENIRIEKVLLMGLTVGLFLLQQDSPY